MRHSKRLLTIIIIVDKSYVTMVSLSKCLIVLYSPLFLGWCETIQCLCDEVTWGERRRQCDVVLGCYWPSDNTSERGSSGPDDDYGWMSGADSVGGWGSLIVASLFCKIFWKNIVIGNCHLFLFDSSKCCCRGGNPSVIMWVTLMLHYIWESYSIVLSFNVCTIGKLQQFR